MSLHGSTVNVIKFLGHLYYQIILEDGSHYPDQNYSLCNPLLELPQGCYMLVF